MKFMQQIVFIALAVSWSFVDAAESYQNELGMKFVRLPAGEFTMGTDNLDVAVQEMPKPDSSLLKDETPAHRVVLTRSFFMGATEATQGQWFDVMKTKPGPKRRWQPANWRDFPVVSVTWGDVQAFITALNKADSHAAYRLPTEAEWEYAARDGSSALRPVPLPALPKSAWYLINSEDQVQPVATREPNSYGLYDMFGNAWEWVNDWYDAGYYAQSPTYDPVGPATGEKKIRRGGSYHCKYHLVRPAYRAVDLPDARYSVLGFRVVALLQTQ